MKRMLTSIVLLSALGLIVVGCGSAKVDQNRPIEQVSVEAKGMTVEQLKQAAGEYQKAIMAKKGDIEQFQEKLKKIPLTEMLGAEAKKLKDEIVPITASIKALSERMNVYVQELKAKGGTL